MGFWPFSVLHLLPYFLFRIRRWWWWFIIWWRRVWWEEVFQFSGLHHRATVSQHASCAQVAARNVVGEAPGFLCNQKAVLQRCRFLLPFFCEYLTFPACLSSFKLPCINFTMGENSLFTSANSSWWAGSSFWCWLHRYVFVFRRWSW